MNNLLKSTLLGGLIVTCMTAQAEAIDGKQPLVCAIFQWNECSTDGCLAVSPEEIRAVRFVNVDFKGKQLKARDPGDKRSSDIRELANRDYQIALQGMEYAMAWSMTIDKADGEMTFSGARENVVFSGFGHCSAD
jgi:hypothetical protein